MEGIWDVLQGAALGEVLGYERISAIEFYVPPQNKNSAWADKFYYLRAFDHTLYKHPDSLLEDTCIDLRGKRETSVVAATGQQNIDR